MKKTLVSIAALAAVSVATPAHGFGMPSAPSMPTAPSVGGGGATVASVDTFIASAAESHVLVRSSAVTLARAVLAKEEVEKIDAKLAAAKTITNPAEKEAKLAEVEADATTGLAKADLEKVAKTDAANWDAKKKENIKNSLHNLALGLLKDTALVASGKGIVSGPPSPAIAPRLPLVKDTLAALVGQVDSLTKVMGGAKSLMSVVKLDSLPTSASAPAMAQNDF